MWALAAWFHNSIEIEVMGFWLQIVAVILVLFCKCGVEAQEIFNGNETNVSFMEFLSYLESIYGIADASPPPNAGMVDLTLIQGAAAKGAVCLDGSLPGYHLDRGFGSGATSWLVNLEGGGWCNSVRTCNFSKTTQRGSSNFFEKQIPFTGILSNKASENPDFYNWNRVKIRYCDGASFSGEGEDKANGLQFRGQRIWQAAIDELMIKGMRNANHVLLSGCSAGGLAVILHCDEFRGFFPETTVVKCFSDAGLFMDGQDVSGGHTLRNFYAGVVSFQGVQRPVSCKNNLNPTSCFFPQNLISNIRTPLFILNAAYDAWQVRASLTSAEADPNGNWSLCRKNIAKCSDSQIQFLQGFRAQILNEVKGFAASMQNGIFLNSCFAHCQSDQQVMWFGNDSPKIDNKTIAQSVGDWYFDRASVKSIDCPYPCDTTCRNIVFR